MLRCPGRVAGHTAMRMLADTEWWLARVEGMPRWLWAVTLLWVALMAAWACRVLAQKGRGADGQPARRGMRQRERLWFLRLLVPPAAVCLVVWHRTGPLARSSC